MAVIFFGLGMFRFMGELLEQFAKAKSLLDITPVFNTIALPMLACMGVLMVAAVLARHFIPKDASREHYNVHWGINHGIGILGYVLLGIVLSGEAARYFHMNTELWEPYNARYLHNAFLLGFWFILSVLLLEIGLVFRSKVLTHVALAGLAVAVMAMLHPGFSMRCVFDGSPSKEAFNNPFAVVLIAQGIILLALGYQGKSVIALRSIPAFMNGNNKSRNGADRNDGIILGAFGVVGLFSLFAILTIEWFNYFEPWAGGPPVLRSVTLFWTIYALVWLGLGFAVRNMPIRLCGLIILFGALVKTTLLDSCVSFGYCSWEWLETAKYSLENWTLLINPYFLTML
jgi:hypothetical protein